MTKPVTVIVEPIYRKAPAVFDEMDFSRLVRVPAGEEAVAEAVERESAAAVVLDAAVYRGPLYEKMPAGGLLARFGVGYDGVDLAKAAARGLLVTNTPDVLESTVAESTLFLAAEVLRHLGAADREIRRGGWPAFLGEDLGGKTWAVIGMGRIGTVLARMLHQGFGVHVWALKSDLSDTEALKRRSGAERITGVFSEIAGADIVSLHLPATAATHHFMDREKLALLRPGAILINTGRGSLVDEEALYDALAAGRLGGAGLDVFTHEPYLPVRSDKDLRTLERVVMTPHLSSATRQCAVRMARRVLANIRMALEKNNARMDLVNPY